HQHPLDRLLLAGGDRRERRRQLDLGHSALLVHLQDVGVRLRRVGADGEGDRLAQDRKSTRLNSSHVSISYAVFCLKKKKNIKRKDTIEKHTYNITLIVLCNTYPSKLTK